MKLDNVTLLIVDCVNVDRAIKSLEHNKRQMKFGKVKLLTSLPTNHPQKETIPHIGSIEQYSHFMVKELANYFKTDFVLVTQHDGFITNPELFQAAFLKYDYIGAPWPEMWLVHGYDKSYNVGNGGFSIRSKRLQRLLRDDHHIQSTHPAEDVTICQQYRPYLEAHGITFAPQEIAQKFSKEYEFSTAPSFGQHGRYKFT